MRCRSCGHPIDANSRFCTYCDCDNYPEMNKVKTKGNSVSVKQETTVSRTYTNNSERKPQNQQANDKRAAAGCIFFAAFIFIIFIIIFTVSVN